MREAISQYLPWLMSAITIVAIELQGRKWPRAWMLSLAGQVFWFLWIACSKQWGFLPMTSILSVQYIRNHIKWKREASDPMEACAEEGAWDGLRFMDWTDAVPRSDTDWNPRS